MLQTKANLGKNCTSRQNTSNVVKDVLKKVNHHFEQYFLPAVCRDKRIRHPTGRLVYVVFCQIVLLAVVLCETARNKRPVGLDVLRGNSYRYHYWRHIATFYLHWMWPVKVNQGHTFSSYMTFYEYLIVTHDQHLPLSLYIPVYYLSISL